ncbi:uncharacterized protein N7459_002011 [Penicillium hispanicum]|uniref:uncharacterized protein n=1 Tax=Penicillium hispanicum TaxID=1080232 RepID=UPI00254258E0|nr:uncharacterized protein N7459_002011 [Penicillium hispanicum]KAJ5591642.1 hypothetical protein N7459_002011 [Penicillium hispanicum]
MASVTCRGDLHMDGAGVVAGAAAPAHLPLPLSLHVDIAQAPLEPAVTEIDTAGGKCYLPASPTSPVSPLSLGSRSAPSSPEMETPRMRRIDPPPTTKSPDSPTHASPHAASRPTSAANSIHHSRSASRSTARSRPPSRHSSFHSSRHAVTTASIVPVPSTRTTPQERRESLLALHRESCRLFQDPERPSTAFPDDIRARPPLSRTASSSYKSRREGRNSYETGASTPPSPIASSLSSRLFEHEHRSSVSSGARPPSLRTRDRSNTLPAGTAGHVHSPSASSIHVPATVMEWTSASTRRQEYRKIDRASRGVRGLWRRVAPRWCQARDSRTPFFEEGKTSREGSVRRFRMDLPDEADEPEAPDKPHAQFRDFLPKGPDGTPRRLWTGHPSKTYS